MATKRTAVCEGIRLGRGGYRVELEFGTDRDLSAWCYVWDGTVFPGGLLSNGEHLYSGMDRTGYDMWLFEGTDALQVVVDYSGNGRLETGSLRIVETDRLWTMLLAMTVFVAAIFYSVLGFCYYDRKYPISPEKKNAFFCVMAISLIASVPYLCGFVITGADLTYHLQRIEGVKDGILGGQFPVRLEPKWLYGHGYADAVFYCNALLYFPAMLRLLGFTVSTSYNVYCIGLNIATAWIAYACFYKVFKKRGIGILCCALYTLSIPRVYKLVITAAAGEGSAFTFLPLVMYGLYRIFTEDSAERKYRTAWVPLTLGLCGLIQTHVLTCEVTASVILFFCLFFIRKIFCKNTFLELMKGVLASLFLSSWFLVPFLDYYFTQDVHIKHVSARTIQDRGLYFAQLFFHFWTTGDNVPSGENGMQYSHPEGVGLVLGIGLGLFLILWYSGAFRKRGEGDAPDVRFMKITAAAVTLLLYMSTNLFPWDRIQALHPVAASLVSSLQFPNRFLGWASVCLIMVFGYCLWHFDIHDKRYCCQALAAAALVGIATSDMYLLDHVNGGQGYFSLYNEEGMGFGYISGGEYLIQGTEESRLTFARPVAGSGAEIAGYEKWYLRVRMQCRNRMSQDGYVDLPLLLYKGYRAWDTDTGQEMRVSAGENHVVRVTVPAGFDGNVEVSFASPVWWRISEAVSLAAAAVLAAVWRHWRKKYAGKEI